MKWLILEHIKTGDGIVKFKIHDQSHRYYEFADNGQCFIAQNKQQIWSESHPASYSNSMNTLYVKGRDKHIDDNELSVSIDKWTKIKEAVQEYNNYHGFTGECIIGEIPSPILPDELFTLE